MPEGDTILRTARLLHGALAGRVVTGFRSSLAEVASRGRTLVGRRVLAVEARGKHLFVRFEGGWVLHTHLRMTGRWRVDARDVPQRPRRAPPRIAVETQTHVATGLRVPVVEFLGPAAERALVARLGPDPLDDGFDAAAARARLRSRPDEEIGVRLLDQSAVAGIGNVYKSELLFLVGIHPFTPTAALSDARLDALLTAARREMGRNLADGWRRTTSALAPARLWVYERTRRPCLRCGTAIEHRRQGRPSRATYFCPTCQPAPASSPPREEG